MENRNAQGNAVRNKSLAELKAIKTSLFSTEASLHALQDMPLATRMKIVMDGFSKRELEGIKMLLGLDYDQLSTLLLLTNRSMHLKKGNERFSPMYSDRIMMILELYSYGCLIFGGLARFQVWMNEPNERTMNKTPLSAISTHSGLLAVRDMITDIRNGHP